MTSVRVFTGTFGLFLALLGVLLFTVKDPEAVTFMGLGASLFTYALFFWRK